ncbi:MAG TPA: FtsX-like permease family protein [Prosthecobacter sp.]
MQSAPLFLAVRYLRPTRSFISVITVISMLGIMLGVGVLVFVMSVFSGWQREFRQMLIGFEPHAMAQPMVQGEGGDWREVLQTLSKMPPVVSALPVVEGTVVVENTSGLQRVSVTGMNDTPDNALLQKLKKHIRFDAEGEIKAEDTRQGDFKLDGDSIVISDSFARQLGAKVGDTLVVHAEESVSQFIQKVREIPEDASKSARAETLDNVTVLSKDLTLVAILRSDTAGYRGYVPLNIAQEFFNLEGNVTGIELELKDPEHPDDAIREIIRTGQVPETWGWSTWEREHGQMLESVKNQRVMMWFILLFVMLVAAICVMNTTITVTVKKRREIGILTALGTRAWQIIAIFLSQAGIVAFVGVILGLLGGFFFLSIRNVVRDFLASFLKVDIFPRDIYFLSSIPSHTDPLDLAVICGVAVFLCLLAALVPSWFAARVDPAVALRDAG